MFRGPARPTEQRCSAGLRQFGQRVLDSRQRRRSPRRAPEKTPNRHADGSGVPAPARDYGSAAIAAAASGSCRPATIARKAPRIVIAHGDIDAIVAGDRPSRQQVLAPDRIAASVAGNHQHRVIVDCARSGRQGVQAVERRAGRCRRRARSSSAPCPEPRRIVEQTTSRTTATIVRPHARQPLVTALLSVSTPGEHKVEFPTGSTAPARGSARHSVEKSRRACASKKAAPKGRPLKGDLSAETY